jgi:DNA-binding MarR family transcriptional regulator
LKERFFNIYHHLADCFVPYWLLSRSEVGGNEKLIYAWLAQQVNSSGAARLHLSLTARTLGMDEGGLARCLMELEENGLINVSRGNINDDEVK